MINIVFFARIREQLGVGQLTSPINQLKTVADLRRQLIEEHEASWSEVLMAQNVVIAVNQVVSDETAEISSGDEVAFYPPVTGG
ncbi:MAG: molybdopterin converting factor subunit 1 [Pseudomonadales bacterium]